MGSVQRRVCKGAAMIYCPESRFCGLSLSEAQGLDRKFGHFDVFVILDCIECHVPIVVFYSCETPSPEQERDARVAAEQLLGYRVALMLPNLHFQHPHFHAYADSGE
jgi:hypothetical protein